MFINIFIFNYLYNLKPQTTLKDQFYYKYPLELAQRWQDNWKNIVEFWDVFALYINYKWCM